MDCVEHAACKHCRCDTTPQESQSFFGFFSFSVHRLFFWLKTGQQTLLQSFAGLLV